MSRPDFLISLKTITQQMKQSLGLEGSMATFHPFSRLPWELRARIWTLTVEPRTVEVHIIHEDPVVPPDAQSVENSRALVSHLVSFTPVPATLQTCQEARSLGLYQRAFSELDTSSNLAAEQRRYVWLNLETDMVSIGRSAFRDFASVAPMIKRLRFERQNSEEYFYHWEVEELRTFSNVKEIHIVCADGMRAWHQASEEHYWPCGRENLFFIDPDDGRMMRSIEMDAMFDQMLDDEYRQQDEANHKSWAEYGYRTL